MSKSPLFQNVWLGIGVCIGCFVVIKEKRQWIVNALLIGYIGVILYLTLMSRKIGTESKFSFVPFYSYCLLYTRKWNGPQCSNVYLLKQMIENVLLFVPLGCLVGKSVAWQTKCCVLCCAILSVAIECLQYHLQLGFFEIDDIIHNSIGAAVGVIASRCTYASRENQR